jgi:biotin transport system substrate-specific component
MNCGPGIIRRTDRGTGTCLQRPVQWAWSVFPVVAFCLLTALAAHVRVPLPGTPVPMTLQLLTVLLAGLLLSATRAAAAMALYLLWGSCCPVFLAGGSGGLPGPTGGYLLGFVLGAWLIGALRGGQSASLFRLVFAGAAGTAVVFAVGVFGVAWWSGSMARALSVGFLPFAPKAVVELALAVALARGVRSMLGSRTNRGSL